MPQEIPERNDARKEHGDRTRQRLLQAARQLLAERGIGAVHLRDVSEAAQVNVAAVSYHFGSLANLLNAAVRDASDAAINEQARLLASLPADAALEDIVAAWIKPTVYGLRGSPQSQILLRIASRAISDPPADMRGWVDDTLERTHGLLARRLQSVLPDLDERELAFRVFCIGGIVNRFNTAATLPESAAASRPELERLLVAAVTGMLLGPGTKSLLFPANAGL